MLAWNVPSASQYVEHGAFERREVLVRVDGLRAGQRVAGGTPFPATECRRSPWVRRWSSCPRCSCPAGTSPAGDAHPAGTSRTLDRRWTRGTTPLARPGPRVRRSDRSVPAVTGRTRSVLRGSRVRWRPPVRSSEWLAGDGRVDAGTSASGTVRACQYYRAIGSRFPTGRSQQPNAGATGRGGSRAAPPGDARGPTRAGSQKCHCPWLAFSGCCSACWASPFSLPPLSLESSPAGPAGR